MASEYAISFQAATTRSDGADVGGCGLSGGVGVGGGGEEGGGCLGTRLNYSLRFVAGERRPKLQLWIVQTESV